MYAEAKELYERAIPVMQTTGNGRGEAITCEVLGTVFHSLHKDVEAKEYFERALAISMQLGDRKGQAI